MCLLDNNATLFDVVLDDVKDEAVSDDNDDVLRRKNALTTKLLFMTVPPLFLLSVLLVRHTKTKWDFLNSQTFKMAVYTLSKLA